MAGASTRTFQLATFGLLATGIPAPPKLSTGVTVTPMVSPFVKVPGGRFGLSSPTTGWLLTVHA